MFNEDILGPVAVVYHRTDARNLINSVYASGYKFGEGDRYGKAFYSTYDLKSQESKKMINSYGPIVVKFAVYRLDLFIFFDYDQFIKSPNYKILKSTKETFLIDQFKHFKMDFSKFNQRTSEWAEYTSDIAFWCYKNISNFSKKIKGVVFTGETDGKVLVCYDENLLFPISVRTEEEGKFEKVNFDKNYLKRILQHKLSTKIKTVNPIPNGISVEDSDFRVQKNDYYFMSKGTWEKGRWLNGVWKGGTWKEGIWKDGTWKGGTWENGYFENGIWEDGIWKGGAWFNGTWKDGTWEGGRWDKGTWEYGVWEYGIWEDGTWENGTWEDGYWHNGVWQDGFWEDGSWETGWIFDPNKKGNFEEYWEWNGSYVKSPIDPKDYFGK